MVKKRPFLFLLAWAGVCLASAAHADAPLDKNGQHRLGVLLDLRVAGTSRWAVMAMSPGARASGRSSAANIPISASG